MIKGCPKGHDTVIKPEDNFCWQCGSKLENVETPRCHCGYHFIRADIFCPNCGAPKQQTLDRIEKEKERIKKMTNKKAGEV